MIRIKTSKEIAVLREGGKILSFILSSLRKYCLDNYRSGSLRTIDVEQKAAEVIKEKGVNSAFLHYAGNFRAGLYPSNICISINDEVVHGVPGDRVLNEGDIVVIDLGILYKGLITDAAISFLLGEDPNKQRLIDVTYDALYKGIDQCKIGNRTGDIGAAIENHVEKSGFSVVKDYCGHGVGYSVHEDPQVPNHGPRGKGDKLVEGLVIAIEPMVVTGSSRVFVDDNKWTVRTADEGFSAQWEHTVAITKNGPVVLTEK